MKTEKIIEYSNKYAVPILRPETSKILIETLQSNKPKKVLEIGTAIGYSTKLISQNTDAKIISIDHNKQYLKVAKKYLFFELLFGKIKLIQKDCLVALSKMLNKKRSLCAFDFIFIDGPKAQYSKILDLCLPMLCEGGTIFIDDVLFHGYENKTENKRFKTIIERNQNFIEKCKKCQNLMNFKLISVEDGIIIAKKGNKNG